MLTALLALGIMAPLMAAADDVADVAPTLISEDEPALEVEDAGITPDSAFYGLDKAMERVRLAFAFGKVNKAKLRLRYAEERLSEAEQMVGNGDEDAAAEAEDAYNDELDKTEVLVDEIESDGTEENDEVALGEVSEIRLGLLSHAEKVSLVKNRILDRMRSGNVSDAKRAHLEEVFGRIATKAQNTDAKVEEKRIRVRTTYKVLSEKNESELTKKEAKFLERVNEYIQKRTELRAKIEKKIRERIREERKGDDDSDAYIDDSSLNDSDDDDSDAYIDDSNSNNLEDGDSADVNDDSSDNADDDSADVNDDNSEDEEDSVSDVDSR